VADIIVRTALEQDEEQLYRCLLEHEDAGSFGAVQSENRIREHIELATRGQGGFHGVIDTPDPDDPIRIAGTIGIVFERYWWTENYHLQILWLFVRQPYRTLRLDNALMEFAKAYRDELRKDQWIELVDSPFSETRLETKLALWRRWGRQIGGIFIIK